MVSIPGLFKTRKEKREFVIWTVLPDGLNFFQGIHEVRMPTARGGYMPALMNLWTIHYDDIKEHAGIFTREEADFYLENMGMAGCFINTLSELKDIRAKHLN